ncbi:hypothetical protein LCGC14_2566540, partial [marine sediment metagenome]
MEKYFNDEQIDHMQSLALIPMHELCVCGWYRREECEGGYMEEHCNHRARVAERQAREREDDV